MTVFQPGGILGLSPGDTHSIEGPHYPAPHTWYAEVKVDGDGYVVKVK